MRALVFVVLLAACNGFDPLAQPSDSPRPYANAGIGSSYPLSSIVTLDGTGSFDPAGNSMTFRWSVVQSPSGSTALPVDPAAMVTTFQPDQLGTYRLRLDVTDTALATDSSEVRIVATGAITGIDVSPSLDIQWLATAQLAATITTVPGKLATYTWSFLSRPAGSTATLQGTGTLHPAFVGDVVGTYVVALDAAVGDEVREATVTIDVAAQGVELGAIPTAYAYSKRLDRIVYADDVLGSGELVTFDPTTSASTALPLGAFVPRSIAIDPYGNYIGVGGAGRVMTYTLSPFAPDQTQNVPGCDAKQISIPYESRIDCFPMDGTTEPILVVDMTTGDATAIPCPVASPVVAASTDGYLFMADEASPQIYEYNEFDSIPLMPVVTHGSLTGITPPVSVYDRFPARAIAGNGWIVDGLVTLVADLHTPVSVAATSTSNNELATASGDHLSVFATDAAFARELNGTIPPIHGMTPTVRFLAYSSDEHRLLVIASSAAGDVVYTVAR